MHFVSSLNALWTCNFLIFQIYNPTKVRSEECRHFSCNDKYHIMWISGIKREMLFSEIFSSTLSTRKKFSLETNILFPSSSGSVHSSEWYGDGELCKIGQQVFQGKENNTDLLFVASLNQDQPPPLHSILPSCIFIIITLTQNASLPS